jgi:hypothetical protein
VLLSAAQDMVLWWWHCLPVATCQTALHSATSAHIFEVAVPAALHPPSTIPSPSSALLFA